MHQKRHSILFPPIEESGDEDYAAESHTVRVLASPDELALGPKGAGDDAWSSRVSILAALAILHSVALALSEVAAHYRI